MQSFQPLAVAFFSVTSSVDKDKEDKDKDKDSFIGPQEFVVG